MGSPYPSTMTCAFVPDHPNPLIPARGGRSGTSGQSIVSDATRTVSRSHSISGFGVLKFRCFGMTRCFIASITLMRLAAPAADSRCPMFVFTDPTSSGRSASRPLLYTVPVACISIGSPTGVPVPCAST